ncbi:hypothetical protein J437_LFUL016349 [Ladona fulva]|uniref:Uncharacterized protein n=1 Tax=Ladona fulva TaxID=123851 RepID=A0A8K0PBA8_LADFU|nr:hypothetical protein J437_LFUL016349 [Ladona fulva]
MEACTKQSQLWKLFQTISLSVNMRSVGQIEFNNWLLSIGATSKYLSTVIYTSFPPEFNIKCQCCRARHFATELPRDGKILSCCLKDLLRNKNNPLDVNFRANIRSYNSALSFTSMGATIVDVSGPGLFVSKVEGQVYHRTSHIEPLDETSSTFAQLYVIDSSEATEKKDETA